MRFGGCLLVFFALLFASTVHADGIFFEAGSGFLYSRGSNAVFLRYQKDAFTLHGQQSFYEASYASWSGPNHSKAIVLAWGLRWKLAQNFYFSPDAGIAYITRTTDNLGTHFQFQLKGNLGYQVGRFDFSVGIIHYSNGKSVFGWDGPNHGENFATIQVGYLF